MRIYICAPIIEKEPEELTIFFKAVKARIIRAGHVPISPWDIRQELPRGEHADYMAVDKAIIRHFADAVLFAGDYNTLKDAAKNSSSVSITISRFLQASTA